MYHMPPKTMTSKRSVVPMEGSADGGGGRWGAGRIADNGVEAAGAGAAATPDPEDGGAYGLGAILVLPDGVAAAATLPELESRSSRRRSAPISAAVWQRMSRSFSSALWMTRSSSIVTSGLWRIGGAGARFKIASKMTAVLLPANGCFPVAIS